MNTIILYSKEKDRELLQELREALVKKGFEDDETWNKMYVDSARIDSVVIWGECDDIHNHLTFLNRGSVMSYSSTIIPVSRNDFQTMFLLF